MLLIVEELTNEFRCDCGLELSAWPSLVGPGNGSEIEWFGSLQQSIFVVTVSSSSWIL